MKNDRIEYIFNILRFIGDILVIHFSFLISFYIRFDIIKPENIQAYYQNMPFIIIFSIIVFKLYNLYNDQTRKPLSDIFYAFIPASMLIILFSVTISYFVQTYKFPRSIFLIAFPILIISLMVWRYLILTIQKRFIVPKKVIIIGSQKSSDKLKENIKKFTNNGYMINEIINFDKLDNLDQNKLLELFDQIEPDIIFITSDIPISLKKDIIYISLDKSWEVSIVPEFYEIMVAGGKLNQLGEFPVYNIRSLKNNDNNFLKRLFDIFISIFSLIILSPIILLIIIAIKLDSKGPIFYKQQRVSKFGKEFTVYKFRTMVKNAEKETGPVLSSNKDTRITKIGRFLRKARLDEIPQLINVLKGEMSIIGPRPERPHFVDRYNKEINDYQYRHYVKTGITGLAQIYGFYSTDPEEKLRMDLLYANNNNLLFDLKIILNTLKVILIGHKSE